MVTISLQVFLKGIHLISIMGNQGTFTKNFKQMVTDAELLYHCAYVVFCVMGLCMHPFFYSVLVSIPKWKYVLQYFLAWVQI
jgi:inositol 1,4,5-triphosphate receptor type 1